MANFSTGMAGLRLRSGGNAPVADLEVDMDQDNRNDSGDCQLRQPSPAPLSSAPSFSQSGPPPSSYAVSTEFDVGPSVPLGLLRMRRRQAALADTSVAHLNLGLAPFARQISPEADEASGPRQTTDTVTATATATPDMPPDMTDASTVTTTVTTATTITATATSTPVAASTGATALAAASPIEADDEDLPPRPEDAIAAMVAPFPQHSFNSHSRPLSRSYHSQSLSLSKSTPNSHSHSHHPSVSATGTPAWNIRPVDCLRLSPESLAMPHLAPLHNDVPSSGYDLQGWISSSSTVESTAALTTGTIDACYVPLPADVIEVDNGNGAPATVDTAAEGAMSSNDQSDSRSTVQDGTAALLAAQARLRQQQNKQFYTAYLRPHQLPFYREMTAARNGSHGPNPPVDVLEADSGSPEEPLPVIAAATASTHQSSDKTRTPTGPYMGHSQRIRLIRKAMAREAGRARSQQSIDGSSTAGSIVVADDDMMDVDMVDPAAFNSSSHISAVDAMGGDDMLEPLTSLPEFGEAGDFYKYMGPFRYRLSSEVAMRCTNLVRNKPRMRRRRQPGEGSATNDGGSSARGSSAKGGSSLHSERCRERHAERRAADCADRTDRADRIETSRDLGRDTLQDGRERRSRVNRRHEQTRLADAHTQALAHVNAQAEGLASHLPSLVGAKVEAEAEAKADSSRPVPGPATTSSLPQHRLRMEQFPLPAWRLPAPVPIEAINVDTP
ncbi:hypothetical protein SCUCBS95973_005045 [Sporothrix curviconia]|uniref:Uncharacterized protein n=1 Tax=Sporothrix curviconia TaxID=1260050 RepID=A0ABP0BTH9_9PEZI